MEVTERAVTATHSEITGDEQLTRFAIAFSALVPYQVFTLPNPYRIIIDMPDVNFRLPPGAGQQGKGLIRAFRYGLFAPGKSRIVIDITRAVRIEKHSMIARQGKGARLSIDLVPTDDASFLAKAVAPAPRAKESPSRRRPARQGAPPGQRQTHHRHRSRPRRASTRAR